MVWLDMIPKKRTENTTAHRFVFAPYYFMQDIYYKAIYNISGPPSRLAIGRPQF